MKSIKIASVNFYLMNKSLSMEVEEVWEKYRKMREENIIQIRIESPVPKWRNVCSYQGIIGEGKGVCSHLEWQYDCPKTKQVN